MATSIEDEVITARADLDMGTRYGTTIFDLARHREPESVPADRRAEGRDPAAVRGGVDERVSMISDKRWQKLLRACLLEGRPWRERVRR